MDPKKKLFSEGYWECYFRKASNSILIPGNNVGKWNKLSIERRYWCADPFPVHYHGEEYVFCEVMDRKKSYGMLGCGKLSEKGTTKISVIQDIGCHTSYPDIFTWQDELYMIPETVERHTIELYRCRRFPNQWEKIAALLTNTKAVDTTVFTYQDKIYLFVYEEFSGTCRLSLGELSMEKKIVENLRVVRQYDQRIGRPAGRIIRKGDQYFRPTQYGVNFYGERIVFYEFTIDYVNGDLRYTEKEDMAIGIDDLEFENKSRFIGTHTYNYDNEYEVVDFCKKRFYPERPILLILKKMGIGGYQFHG